MITTPTQTIEQDNADLGTYKTTVAPFIGDLIKQSNAEIEQYKRSVITASLISFGLILFCAIGYYIQYRAQVWEDCRAKNGFSYCHKEVRK